jgi:hypothetical protein
MIRSCWVIPNRLPQPSPQILEATDGRGLFLSSGCAPGLYLPAAAFILRETKGGRLEKMDAHFARKKIPIQNNGTENQPPAPQ